MEDVLVRKVRSDLEHVSRGVGRPRIGPPRWIHMPEEVHATVVEIAKMERIPFSAVYRNLVVAALQARTGSEPN